MEMPQPSFQLRISAADADPQPARPRASCCLTRCYWAASAALWCVLQVLDSAFDPVVRRYAAHRDRLPIAWKVNTALCWPAGTITFMFRTVVCTWEPICDRCSEGGAPLDAGSSASRAPLSLAGGFLWEQSYAC